MNERTQQQQQRKNKYHSAAMAIAAVTVRRNENRTTELYARRKKSFLCDDDDARGKAKSQARINYILDSICVPTYVLPYYKIRSKFQRKRKREDAGQF